MNTRALSHFLGPVLLLLVGVMEDVGRNHHSAHPTNGSGLVRSATDADFSRCQGDDLGLWCSTVAVVENTFHLEANGPMLKSLPQATASGGASFF